VARVFFWVETCGLRQVAGPTKKDEVRGKMVHNMRLVLAALVLVAFATSASADISKLGQLPDLTVSGCNLQSQWDLLDGEPNVIRADNWICPNGLPVTDVHWWGSYLFNLDDGDHVGQFEISIHANDPVTNLPGTLLYREVFDLAEVNETLVGPDANGEEVYEYTVYLETPFEQTQGEIYWLDIIALTPNQKRWPMWGWHTAVQMEVDEMVRGSAQTTLDRDGPDDPTWGGKQANPWQSAEYDMAFELTTIPEPSLLALFGLGMFAAWRRFRRR